MNKISKSADFVKLTSSFEAVEKLQSDLKSCLSDVPCDQLSSDRLSDQRVVCDRVLRACNHWAGDASCRGQHLQSLTPLAEIACHGFRASTLQNNSFYLEKILFHLLKNVSARDSSYQSTIQLSNLLYTFLIKCPEDLKVGGDYVALAKSSFQFLWKAAGDQEQKNNPCACNQEILCLRLHALRFLILVERSPSHTDSPLTIARHVKFVTIAFESKGKSCSKEDVCFLNNSVEDLLVKPLLEAGTLANPWARCLVELTVHRCRSLCKRNCFQQGKDALQQAYSYLKSGDGCCLAGLTLTKFALEIQEQGRSRGIGKCLDEMANAVLKVDSSGEGWLCQALSECIQFAVSCVDGHFKSTADSRTLCLKEVLNLASFLKAHYYLLEKQMSVVPKDGSRQLRSLRQHQFTGFQQFTNATCSFLQTGKDVNCDDLQHLVGVCKGVISRMLTSLRDLTGQDAAEFLNQTASCVHNVAYWFYNQKKYQEASDIVSPLCEQLASAGPGGDPDLSSERLHRCFRLHVESCRKAGQTELGLAAVTLWLRALRGQIQQQMAEPIALWVKLKTEGARNGNEDLRLHTLKDGFGDHPVDPELMVSLLAEEIKGYKCAHGDTGQERYNTICDLLELCSESSSLEHHRPLFLLELAQVLCYHDYTGQTDCSALDAVQESLSLLNSSDHSKIDERLLDIKAQALLWQYICTLEANMQESMEEQQRKAKFDSQRNGIEYEPNDLNYEDKLLDDQSVQEGICFTLAGETGPMKSLEEALNLWQSVLSGLKAPLLYNAEQTVFSLHLLGSIFRLMGKPLQSIQAFQLACHLCSSIGDHIRHVGALCQLTKLLFYLESPTSGQITLEEAENVLKSADSATETYTLAELTCKLLRSHLFRVTHKVVEGVGSLMDVLQHPLLQKSSKACYLLKVQALQELSMFLRLPPMLLPQDIFKQLSNHGGHNPETALTEAHKLLRSIVLLLLGKDLLSSSKAPSVSRFVDNGDNLLQKWQVLADLLSCSQDLITTLCRMGSVSDAKSYCLEGLRLAKNLQSMRLCADFLVRKAELETLRAENQLSEDDLQYVVFLMESCTDFTSKTQKKEIKIQPSKGKKPKNRNVGLIPESPPNEDFLKSVQFQYVDTRDVLNPPASPTPATLPKKTFPCFVSHDKDCTCSLCSDLVLSLLCTRWMVAQAENDPRSLALLKLALQRCQSITHRFSRVVQALLKEDSKFAIGMTDEIVARIYFAMVSLSPPAKLSERTLEDGLNFLSSRPPNFPKYWRAGLLLAKALNSTYRLATSHAGCITDLFMQVWGWQPQRHRRKDPDRSYKCMTATPSITLSKVKDTEKVAGDNQTILSMEGADSESLLLPTRPPTTPLRKDHLPTPLKPVVSTQVKKGSVTIYNEESPVPELLPKAPRRRQTRAVIKVDFSDSDLEMPDNDPDQQIRNKKTSCAKSGVRGRGTRKSKALLGTSDSEEEEVSLKSKPRRGRPSTKKAQKETSPSGLQRRRQPGKTERAPKEIEMLRCIKEEPEYFLDDSIEELRASDTEERKPARGSRKGQRTSKKEARTETRCEILRRDVGAEQQSSPMDMKVPHTDPNLFSLTGLSSPVLGTFSTSDLDSISSLLRESLESVAHFPPSILYSRLCRLLALCTGGQDPYLTALLVSESVSITLRHQLNSDIHRKLRKLRKGCSGDLTDQFQCLNLKDQKDSKVQHLSDLEELFRFPKQPLDTERFREQLQHIPGDTAVCILTLADSQSRRPGDHLLLTRLEHGSPPVNIQIPTAHLKMSMSSALLEFDDIQKQQKIINNLTEKKEWWEGRMELDSRMKTLIQLLEQILGCWKVLLMPPCSVASVAVESCKLSRVLPECGFKDLDPALLKAFLGGSHLLTPRLIQSFMQGFCLSQPERAQEILQGAVEGLTFCTENTKGHVVLVLDKLLQKLPWESIPCLMSRSVTRLPSLNFLLSYGLIKKHQPQMTLVRGVEPKQTFYVLNPHANLPGTEERFRDWFKNEPGWKGVIRCAPKPEQLEYALTKQDLYVYVGHGAGAHFLDIQTLQRLDCNAVVLLFGCSSAALAVRGDLEATGIVLKYLMAGCPLILGNLWDVTDREIDRYTVAFLQSWLKAGPRAPLLKHLSESRQAPKLRYIIGAAPVAYGLPVSLR
ncbi:separin [Pelobates cultripes]|uniref:separase n=1 Tax=Pelobates cultripes TaxID=61616 RepID=A0AAD1R6P1_PELCU|nr:separin [Pelobates cultripes]